MSDKFEQWSEQERISHLSSLQGEAVGEAFNGRCFLYDAHPVKNLHIENGANLFTYPPDASAKIAELEAKLADNERFIAAAFDAHPNLDLDIEAIQESKKGGVV